MFRRKRKDPNTEEQYPKGWSAEDDLRLTLERRSRELKKALDENYELRKLVAAAARPADYGMHLADVSIAADKFLRDRGR